MARSRNVVELIGNLGNDPDIKHSSSGGTITRISVATTEKWNDKSGNQQERTEWHRVVFFGKLAEIAGEYLAKGMQVFIEGKLRYEKVSTDQGDRYYTDIVAEELIMFNSGGGERRDRNNDERQPPRGNSRNSYDNGGSNHRSNNGGHGGQRASDNRNRSMSNDSSNNFTDSDIPF